MHNAVSVIADEIGKHEKPLTAAIDGRCAAGKTTFAEHLRELIGCSVIHADSFFLRPEQRTAERLNEPGGSIDYERLISEVMEPLRRGQAFSYCPFSCKTQCLDEKIHVEPNSVTIIEGSYNCHPLLWKYYGLRVFFTVDPEEQLKRIERRNRAYALTVFRERWIPLEEKYFTLLQIAERCGCIFDIRE